VGRLADAQEFEHLEFARARFAPALLEELLAEAASSVRVEGDRVIIRHLYTERRVTPLNLYLRHTGPAAGRHAILDYGAAIKELAAANIFTGDMLLKNFGVTRHGRVIFYDYDELCLLTECNFRSIPETDDPLLEMAADPWFSVSERDVFPEEFRSFFLLPGPLGEAFLERHGDLLSVDFWRRMQARQASGEVVEVLPYRDERRLRHQAGVS
jgi:isocitrate dehydrogenase kinase/phosphatase